MKNFREYLDSVLEENRKIKSFKDKNGDKVYIIPDIKFDKDIDKTIKKLKNSEYDEFIYSELSSNEGITDKNKKIIFWGSDIMDY